MNKNQRHRRMKAKRRARNILAMYHAFCAYAWNDEMKALWIPLISDHLNRNYGTPRSVWDLVQ